MSPLSKFLPQGSLVAIAALALVFSVSACSESNFAGNTRGGKFGLDGKAGADANDGEAESDVDSGGSESNGGSESGLGQSDSGDGGIDTDDGNGTGGGDDLGSGDSNGGNQGSDDNNGDDFGDDGDGISKKTRSELTVRHTRADQKHSVKVELMIKNKVVESATFNPPGKGKVVTLPNLCRKGLDTCMKVTFFGDDGTPRVAGSGGSSCTFINKTKSGTTYDTGSKTTVKLDVDAGGAGGVGTCRADEDDTYFFECPESKTLKVAKSCPK